MIRIASRASDLALWQANHVAEQLRAANPGVPVEVQTFSTRGDREDEPALSTLGGEGLFTAEVDRALLEEKADLAVHSLKDLPINAPPGLALVAIPVRGPVEDALVSEGAVPLAELPPGARVGTSSPRRAAFLAHERSDLEIVNIRGNVPTRVARVTDGDLAATVLARAGLARLALTRAVAEILGPPRLLPAPGQGALAITARAGDRHAAALAAQLDDPATRRAVEAERGVLAGLGGGCSIPLGVFAERAGAEWRVASMLFLGEGRSLLSDSRVGPDPARLADEAARELRRQGAPA